MSFEVVIAARGGPDAKSRLAGRLDLRQRQGLVEAMLADMLDALTGDPRVERIYVATPTPVLAQMAARAGAVVIIEAAPRGLSLALEGARRRIAAVDPATIVALLPGDLPLIDADELAAGADLAQDGRIALAPAGADGGTGAIVQRAGVNLPLAFGRGSFARHLAGAWRLRSPARVIDAPSLAFDIDRPADLERLTEAGRGRAAAFVRGREAAA